jgi:hypothetical protein
MSSWIPWHRNNFIGRRPGGLVRPRAATKRLYSDPLLASPRFEYHDAKRKGLGIVISTILTNHPDPCDDFTACWALVLFPERMGWVPTYELEEYLDHELLGPQRSSVVVGATSGSAVGSVSELHGQLAARWHTKDLEGWEVGHSVKDRTISNIGSGSLVGQTTSFVHRN